MMSIVGVLVVFVFTVLTLVLIPHDAHAVTRSEIYHLKTNIESLKDQIKSYDSQIGRQTVLVNGYEKSINDYKEAERIAREWDRFTDTEGSRNALRDAHTNLILAENQFKDAKRELDNLLNNKNSVLITLQSLQKKLTNDEKILKENSRIELQGLTRVIGVQLSKTCETMIKNDFNTNCPTYQQLQELDTSLKASGEFGYIDGFYQRGKPYYQNDHMLYNFEKDFTIVVNPSGNLASRIKMITIENNLDTYLMSYDMQKKNNTRTMNHDRYVDSCKDAVINSSNWKFLLPDTIHYLRTGCTVTQFNEVHTIQDPHTEIDISTTQYWKDKVWLEDTKVKCKELCKQY